MSVTKTTFLGDKVDERLNQFLRFLEAEKPEFLPPQLDVMGLVRRLAITNPITAAQELPQKLAQSRQMLEEYTPGQPVDPKLLDQFMGLTGFAPAGITAYHGSPYLFRQFDPSKVGAGEGAQAYGVGAGYTAEARPVAEAYAQANRGRAAALSGEIDKLPKPAQMEVYKTLNRPEGFIKQAEILDITKRYPETTPIFESSKSYLYKGDIPDEILPKFLDWDKPISQQSKEIQDVAKQFGMTTTPSGLKEARGSDLYKAIAGAKAEPPFDTSKEWASYKAATDYLQNLGVAGIRYLDRASRGEGKGTSNFIPFRPEDYKIQEINDIPIEDYIRQGLL